LPGGFSRALKMRGNSFAELRS